MRNLKDYDPKKDVGPLGPQELMFYWQMAWNRMREEYEKDHLCDHNVRYTSGATSSSLSCKCSRCGATGTAMITYDGVGQDGDDQYKFVSSGPWWTEPCPNVVPAKKSWWQRLFGLQ